ncbi:MAG TPA: hypothetical protein VNB06_14510 [Thermoanaerobaculia bacterium]|nr:hypothetical protein [Thermoanaerobaculia bacterium]
MPPTTDHGASTGSGPCHVPSDAAVLYAERPVRALEAARLDVLREELRRSGFALCVVRGEDQVDMVLGILDEADAVVVGRRGEDWLVRWSPRAG